MTRKRILSVLAVLLVVTATLAVNPPLVLFELRVSKTQECDPATPVYFAAPRETKTAVLGDAQQREEGDFKIFQKSFRLMSGSKRALIIQAKDRPGQVFRLAIPRGGKQPDWTAWRRPNYLETNALWNFLNFNKPADRSSNAPPTSFELRYKLE